MHALRQIKARLYRPGMVGQLQQVFEAPDAVQAAGRANPKLSAGGTFLKMQGFTAGHAVMA